MANYIKETKGIFDVHFNGRVYGFISQSGAEKFFLAMTEAKGSLAGYISHPEEEDAKVGKES